MRFAGRKLSGESLMIASSLVDKSLILLTNDTSKVTSRNKPLGQQECDFRDLSEANWSTMA
jgi:hypothetical protein